jgi:hypothetical protein
MLIRLPDFVSVNSLDALPDGRYLLVESVYDLPGIFPLRAILSELLTGESNAPVAADLQILHNDGSVRFRDYARAADGEWRDSYGAKSNSLAEMMPRELSTAALVNRRSTPVNLQGGRMVQIATGG